EAASCPRTRRRTTSSPAPTATPRCSTRTRPTGPSRPRSSAPRTPPASTDAPVSGHLPLGIRRSEGANRRRRYTMADYALFIGWGQVVHGREEMSLRVFQETVEFWGRCQQDNRMDSFEPFLLEPHGGGLTGFMLIYGERARLDDVRESEDFERIMARAGAAVHDPGVITAYAQEPLPPGT